MAATPATRLALALLAAGGVAACTPPDYPAAGSPPGTPLPVPAIEPIEAILRQRDTEARTEAAQAELDARGADLRARAEALRRAEP